ncbi:MAG: hypothetical protein ABIH68_06555 [bacterium]
MNAENSINVKNSNMGVSRAVFLIVENFTNIKNMIKTAVSKIKRGRVSFKPLKNGASKSTENNKYLIREILIILRNHEIAQNGYSLKKEEHEKQKELLKKNQGQVCTCP